MKLGEGKRGKGMKKKKTRIGRQHRKDWEKENEMKRKKYEEKRDIVGKNRKRKR